MSVAYDLDVALAYRNLLCPIQLSTIFVNVAVAWPSNIGHQMWLQLANGYLGCPATEKPLAAQILGRLALPNRNLK